MTSRVAHWVTIVVLLLPALARPCGPDFPPAFVWRDTGDLMLKLPETHFYSELEFHYGAATGPAAPFNADTPVSLIEIDVQDVRDALSATSIDAVRQEDLAEAYRAVRKVTRGLRNNLQPRTLSDGPVRRESPAIDSTGPSKKTSFRFDVYTPLFQHLPEEFQRYAEGATAFHLGDFQRAVTIWQALLDLPPEKRRYRSVWTAYMLGKALLRIDTAAAISYFEQTRQLAAEGFPDPLGLQTASLGWQAHAEALLGEYKSSIHHYLEQFRAGSDEERNTAHLSLDFVCGALMRSGNLPEEVQKDPVCVEVVTLWVLSGRARHSAGRRWTETLVASPPDQPVEAAGQLAHLYYNAGEMDLAARWADLSSTGDLAAAWVRSKLLLRAGKMAEAESVIVELHAALARGDLAGPHLVSRNSEGESRPLARELANELGTLRLKQDEYAGALEAFLGARSIADATYIADQVMTADELEAFLAAHAGTYEDVPDYTAPYEQAMSPAALLRYILARRLTRQGEFERARPYFPDTLSSHIFGPREDPVPLRDLLDQYVTANRRAEDKSLPEAARAEGWFDLARVTRTWGMELLGTEQAPDWRMFDGMYTPYGETRQEAGTATPAEAVRVAANAPVPNHRFHYRSLAADRMWRAAELLPDNDEKTAQALWYGGTWIADTHPRDADRFYKALVRRCRQLPIGQAADEKRWFPEKPEGWP